MKILFQVLVLSLLGSYAFSQDAIKIVNVDKQVKDIGQVIKGEKVKGQYILTNISDNDIEIDLVSTCECTEAKWTSGPIKPGENGFIDFIFDSNKKDVEEPIDVDVYFINSNPETGNPYSIYLQYTFTFK